MKDNYSRNLGFILMGIGLLLAAAGIYGLTRSEEYQARTRIHLPRPEVSSIEGLKSYDPYFIQTEFETIRSQVILSNVVSRLDLDAKWGKRSNTSESVALLQRRLDLRPVRGTALVDIFVVSNDAVEAAQIANTIAEVYRDWRQKRHVALKDHKLAEAPPIPTGAEIVEIARPPTTPMRRTKPLGALLVVAGLVCFGWGLKVGLFSQSSDQDR